MNKKIFISGGAQRIGKALVYHFHKKGWDIIFQYRSSKEQSEKIEDELNKKRTKSCKALQCDFDNKESSEQFNEKLSGSIKNLHALVNNASTFYPKSLKESTELDWNKLTSSNLKQPIFITKTCAGELVKNKGSIVNIADIHAEHGLDNYSIYTAAKAGLINFTKSIAKEYAPDLLVNSVSPGAILWDVNEPSEEKKKEILDSIPLKRIGNEHDIVSIIDFLVLENSYMTGRNINIDGGKSLG